MCWPAARARLSTEGRSPVTPASNSTPKAGSASAASRSRLQSAMPWVRATAASRSGLRPTRSGRGTMRSSAMTRPPSSRIATKAFCRCCVEQMRPVAPLTMMPIVLAAMPSFHQLRGAGSYLEDGRILRLDLVRACQDRCGVVLHEFDVLEQSAPRFRLGLRVRDILPADVDQRLLAL